VCFLLFFLFSGCFFLCALFGTFNSLFLFHFTRSICAFFVSFLHSFFISDGLLDHKPRTYHWHIVVKSEGEAQTIPTRLPATSTFPSSRNFTSLLKVSCYLQHNLQPPFCFILNTKLISSRVSLLHGGDCIFRTC
jgi:hypothetical protein